MQIKSLLFEDGFVSINNVAQDRNNPIHVEYFDIALNANFNYGFIGAEYTKANFADPVGPDIYVGQEETDGWYITGGIRHKTLTYHLTYAGSEIIYTESLGGKITNPMAPAWPVINFSDKQTVSTRSWTVGLRWDFHKGAAFQNGIYRS